MELRAVGLLSPGDMGHVVGQRLIAHGMPVVTCLEGRSERTRKLATKSGIRDVSTYENLVRETDMILSIMVPGEAVRAARKVTGTLRKTRETIVYVDCNAIARATGREIDGIIREVRSRYVDASIIGGPPRREGTTKFYASGPDVEAFMTLGNYGLEVRPLGPEVGSMAILVGIWVIMPSTAVLAISLPSTSARVSTVRVRVVSPSARQVKSRSKILISPKGPGHSPWY